MKEKKDLSLDEKNFKKALMRKALGYDTEEVIEEYVTGDEGNIVLSKKKVTKKNVPPDVQALKMLLDSEQTPLTEMTDEQLEEERARLLEMLYEQDKKIKGEKNCKEKRQKTVKKSTKDNLPKT